MSFFKFKPEDMISTVFTAYPSYQLIFTPQAESGISANTRILSHSSLNTYQIFTGTHGTARIYQDLNNNNVTASWAMSGAPYLYNRAENLGTMHTGVTVGESYALERLRHVYSSGSFKKEYNYAGPTNYGLHSSSYYITSSATQFCVINIPQVLYGSKIKPGSFTIDLNYLRKSYLNASTVLNETVYSYTFTDDGYGGLYSASALIGSIFYNHGIVLIDDGHINLTGVGGPPYLGYMSFSVTASFSGTNPIPVNMYLCRVPRGELNFSNNPSYTSRVTSSNRDEITTRQPKTFITGIGIYDENYKLIGVAKLANPLLNEEDTALLFKLKLHY